MKKNIKKNLEDEIEMKPSKMSYREFVKKMMPKLTGKASIRMKEIGKLWQEQKKQSGGMLMKRNKMPKF